MFETFADIRAHRELLGILVMRNLKIRYKGSALGFVWTLINPLFFILIYAVFLKLLRCYDSANPVFLPMLVTGVIVWHFLSMCLGDALHAIVGNASLVTKTAFPRIILPSAMAVSNLINFLLSLAVLAGYLLVLRIQPDSHISFAYVGMLPVAILTQLALCLGLSLIVSSLNVFFRDTEHLLGVLLLAWFFLTPVIYPFEFIPAEFQRLAFLNPMTGIVTVYRSALLGTGIMAPRLVLMSFAVAWMVCVAGVIVFQRLQVRFAEEL